MSCRGHSCHPCQPRAPAGRFEYRRPRRDRPNRSGRHYQQGFEVVGVTQRAGRGPCDILLEKPRFGAFHGTDLELILRSRGIDTIIVTGIATNVCCETTAREAAVRDFRVFFLSDGPTTFGIGDVSAAQLQRATCATLGLLFGQVVTVDEMIGKILPSAFPCVAKNFEPG